MSIAKKTAKGALWLSTSKILQQGSSFVVTAILSRLLLPSDFGLIAMINVYIAFIIIFTNIGFGTAIINKQEATHEQISTLYWLNHFFGLLSFITIAASTPLAVFYFHEPRLKGLIWIVALNTLITPYFSIHRKLLEKEIEFVWLSKIDVVSIILSCGIGVALAGLGFGVYSLIAQSLSLNLFFLIFLRKANPWRADYVFSLKKVKELIAFSLKYKGAMVTNYFSRNVDYLILGHIFSATILGYYSFAYNIMYLPVKRISYVFTETLFPAFSAIKKDLKKIREGYIKCVQLVAIITFPLMVYIALYAHSLILYIFGEKWLPVVKILQILAAAGALQSVDQLSEALFAAVDRENVLLFLNSYKLFLMIAAIFAGAAYGINGVAWAILTAKIIQVVTSIIFLKIYVDISIRKTCVAFVGPVLGCVSIVMLQNIIHKFFNSNTIYSFILQSCLVILCYCATILLTNRNDIRFFINLLTSRT